MLSYLLDIEPPSNLNEVVTERFDINLIKYNALYLKILKITVRSSEEG